MNYYYCKSCGALYQSTALSIHTLQCCSHEVERLEATIDPDHAIKIRKAGNFITVSLTHPKVEIHHIQFISLETNLGYYVKNIKVGDEPTALFTIDYDEVILNAYAFCNLHLLFKDK